MDSTNQMFGDMPEPNMAIGRDKGIWSWVDIVGSRRDNNAGVMLEQNNEGISNRCLSVGSKEKDAIKDIEKVKGMGEPVSTEINTESEEETTSSSETGEEDDEDSGYYEVDDSCTSVSQFRSDPVDECVKSKYNNIAMDEGWNLTS
ncbi:hypothetical protein U1Q18_017854 [Sarracenia purpurea var. burkii]